MNVAHYTAEAQQLSTLNLSIFTSMTDLFVTLSFYSLKRHLQLNHLIH